MESKESEDYFDESEYDDYLLISKYWIDYEMKKLIAEEDKNQQFILKTRGKLDWMKEVQHGYLVISLQPKPNSLQPKLLYVKLDDSWQILR